MPFTQLGLPASLLRNVLALGYTTPTPIQAKAIPSVMSGKDLIATAQTGTGKTAAFLLPVMSRLLNRPHGSAGAVVLAPTRELAQQIHTVFRGLATGLSLRAGLITGGVPMGPQRRDLRGGTDLIVATPGRLLAHLRDEGAKLPDIGVLVLDEADQMFDMGFFPDIKNIIGRLPRNRQTLLFSATMPPEIVNLAKSIQQSPVTISVGQQGKAVDSVTQVAYPVSSGRKTALLEHLLDHFLSEQDASVLVFTRTRRGAKKLTQRLFDVGHELDQLHADRSPTQRERAMRGFRDRRFPILVATNIAARGIDVRHVTHVINFDVPAAPDEYVHRIGRTGRAGDEGDALVLVTPEEQSLLRRIERQLGKPLPRRKLPDFDYGPAHQEERPTKKLPVKPAKSRSQRPAGRGGRGRVAKSGSR